MALTRKSLKAMGISDEQIDSIIEMHTETVDGLKADRDRYRTDAEKLPDVQKRLTEAEKKLEEASGDESYKGKYDKLQAEYEKYKSDQAAKAKAAAKEAAYRALLKEAGVADKRIDTVLRVTDLGTIELGDDGKIKDADGAKAAIRKDWADFIGSVNTQGANVGNPPEQNGGNVALGSLSMEEYIKARTAK